MLIVTREAYNRLRQRTKDELLQAVFASGATEQRDPAFDWDDVIDLTPGQVEEFMRTLNDETTEALRLLATHGPVIHASILDGSGVADYASFQRSTTRRTRTVTGGEDDYLLTWDDWAAAEGGVGRYAITPATHRSLRVYFGLM